MNDDPNAPPPAVLDWMNFIETRRTFEWRMRLFSEGGWTPWIPWMRFNEVHFTHLSGAIAKLGAIWAGLPTDEAWDIDRGPLVSTATFTNNEYDVEVRETIDEGDLYDDIERLSSTLAELEDLDDGTTFSQVVTPINDVLKMLLTHDQSRRDRLAQARLGEGHCRHGKYIGGSGADLMCGPCEDGAK